MQLVMESEAPALPQAITHAVHNLYNHTWWPVSAASPSPCPLCHTAFVSCPNHPPGLHHRCVPLTWALVWTPPLGHLERREAHSHRSGGPRCGPSSAPDELGTHGPPLLHLHSTFLPPQGSPVPGAARRIKAAEPQTLHFLSHSSSQGQRLRAQLGPNGKHTLPE